ncbi:glycerophosphodiester phosphodiesterase [Solihabitans fulvus]|uniref:Glycerophosphodiester phosphodiesterase n=1 Tax=Solihabitans fulvus TaxID=1892852 RepID=A0A5B2X1P3_9PSEU|nr:glycerophosphodiester phosphodiesterase family protein [Solihabitans fulvus]KAA2257127.1 glycerophosphodiester phosphodiesterase [Solihabitans fulvus]
MTVQPAVVAHRGASAHRAEHTLAAYALALEQGADGLECDIRVTRDGHLVCVHDRKVDRTSSGSGVVSELTLDRLAELDFGHWHDELPASADALVRQPLAAPSAPPVERGLLTLEALLGLVADTGVKLFVETKHPVRYGGLVEAKLVALLTRYGLASPATKDDSRVVMMSFSTLAVRRMREYAPRVPTVLLLGRLSAARRDGTLPPWADYTGPGVHLLRADPDYVARSAERGHDTYCWTVDEPADVELCRRLGVRYLATNSPRNTRHLLGSAESATVAP